MKIRLAKPSDADRMYGAFLSASVKSSDIHRDIIPPNGFYEYNLPFIDFRRRLSNSDLALVVEEKEKVMGYLLTYLTKTASFFLEREQHQDPVFKRLNSVDGGAVYADQLFIGKGVPIYVAGRIADYFDFIMQNEKIPLVISAVPEAPWKNVSSTRFVLCRGFKPESLVSDDNITLRLFTKQYFSNNPNQ